MLLYHLSCERIAPLFRKSEDLPLLPCLSQLTLILSIIFPCRLMAMIADPSFIHTLM